MQLVRTMNDINDIHYNSRVLFIDADVKAFEPPYCKSICKLVDRYISGDVLLFTVYSEDGLESLNNNIDDIMKDNNNELSCKFDYIVIGNSGKRIPMWVYNYAFNAVNEYKIPVFFDNDNVAAMMDKLFRGWESWKYEICSYRLKLFYERGLNTEFFDNI